METLLPRPTWMKCGTLTFGLRATTLMIAPRCLGENLFIMLPKENQDPSQDPPNLSKIHWTSTKKFLAKRHRRTFGERNVQKVQWWRTIKTGVVQKTGVVAIKVAAALEAVQIHALTQANASLAIASTPVRVSASCPPVSRSAIRRVLSVNLIWQPLSVRWSECVVGSVESVKILILRHRLVALRT